jgi:hypothetical protein
VTGVLTQSIQQESAYSHLYWGPDMKLYLSVVCAYLVFAIPSGFGQSSLWGVSGSVSPGPKQGEYTASYTVSFPTITRIILPGRPYSGEEIFQNTKILPDGTRTIQPGPSTTTFRDSTGRMRIERHAFHPMGIINWVDAPIVPEICDPIAGFLYYLDTINRIAYRAPLPQESVRILANLPGEIYTASRMKDGDVTRANEPLGTKMMDGLEVQGRRMTSTYYYGTPGNDYTIITTTDMWRSPELGLTVFTKTTDPRTGEFTASVKNISRAEPDPSLFQIPSGYKIVDEQKIPFAFTIPFTGAAK